MSFELQIDLRIVFRYDATAEVDQWKRCFEVAAKLLFHATDGQFRLRKLDAVNDGVKDENADVYVRSYEGASFTGSKMNILNDEQLKPHTIVHELGHYLFNLGDEYKKNADESYDRRCRTDPTTGECLMEFGSQDGVHFNQAGDVVEGPVQYFCYEDHDPDHDTTQEHRHHMSCWDRIKVLHPGVTIPTGTISTQLANADLPTWTLTEYDKWQIVFLDGAPPVNSTAAMQGLRSGLRLWVDLLSLSSAADRFGVVAANANPVLVPLMQPGRGTDLDSIRQQIDDFEFEGGGSDFSQALASLTSLGAGRPVSSNPELTLLSFGPTPINASFPDPAPNTGNIRFHTFAASVGGVVGNLFSTSNDNASEFRATETALEGATAGFETQAHIGELATTLLTSSELVLFHRTDEHEALDPSEEEGSYTFQVEEGVSELIVVIVLDKSAAGDGDWDLHSPDDPSEVRTGENYLVRVIRTPTPGTRTLVVRQPREFQLLVAARNRDLGVELSVTQTEARSVRVTAVVETPELAVGLESELFVFKPDGTGDPQRVNMQPSDNEEWQYEATVALDGPGLHSLEARFRNRGEASAHDEPPPENKEYVRLPVPEFQRVVRRDFVVE